MVYSSRDSAKRVAWQNPVGLEAEPDGRPLITIFPGTFPVGLLGYIVAWIIIPEDTTPQGG